MQKKCIEPLGESKSDYEIFAGLAKRLGVYEAYTMGGKTELDWVKQMFHASDLPNAITWEEFEEKGYYVVPPPEGRPATPALRWFAEGRPRDTPDWGPHPADTVEAPKACRPGRARSSSWPPASSASRSRGRSTPSGPPSARSTSRRGRATAPPNSPPAYPLQLISPHPRFSFHTMGDAKDSWTNEVKDHRVLKEDGRYYWIIGSTRGDAAARGIADGDLVRAFNDRGSVILAAQVTERVPAGVVHSYESCADYDPVGAPGRVAGPGGLREHPHAQALHHADVDGDGQQLLPHPGGEVGRLRRGYSRVATGIRGDANAAIGAVVPTGSRRPWRDRGLRLIPGERDHSAVEQQPLQGPEQPLCAARGAGQTRDSPRQPVSADASLVLLFGNRAPEPVDIHGTGGPAQSNTRTETLSASAASSSLSGTPDSAIVAGLPCPPVLVMRKSGLRAQSAICTWDRAWRITLSISGNAAAPSIKTRRSFPGRGGGSPAAQQPAAGMSRTRCQPSLRSRRR